MSNRSISRECGYEANVQGEPRIANPHISGTWEYNEWFAGWDEADGPASAVILTGFDQLASWVDDHCGGNQLADTPAAHITDVERVAKQLQHEAECESIHYGDDWAEFLESVEWNNVLRFVARDIDQITADK